MKQLTDHPGPTVALPMKNGYRIVRCSDIVRCEAAGNYTKFFLASGQEFSVCLRLKQVEEMLPEAVFCRVHRSHLVNLEWVEMWVRGEGNFLEMADGAMAPVARLKTRKLKTQLQLRKVPDN